MLITIIKVLKVFIQTVTLITPLVKGFISILEQNGFKNKK